MAKFSSEYQAGFAAGLRLAIGIASNAAERVANVAETHRSEGAVCVLVAFAEVLAIEIGAAQPESAITTAPAVAPRLSAAESRREAKLKGYEGDPCPDCGAMTMVRNGTCLKCETCGATTGCS
jgi:ribonucleoside-diphosphate reductase alpha chain